MKINWLLTSAAVLLLLAFLAFGVADIILTHEENVIKRQQLELMYKQANE